MADPCEGHFCDQCAKCRTGVCCQRDRIFPKPKKRPTEVADTVRYRVTASLEFEASVTDERAQEIAESLLKSHLWTWNPKVLECARIDGTSDA